MSERNFQQEAEAFAEYAANGSQAAFRRVVNAWLPLVMGTAMRQSDGQRTLAEDIAQIVFIDLARKAKSLRAATISGWLYRHTCFTAAKLLRSERRRKKREQIAAAGTVSGDVTREDRLDDLLMSMDAADREALLLRYVEGRNHEEVAEALGISRAAAQKRSERALERLRLAFRSSLTAGSVAALLAPPVSDAATLVHRISAPVISAGAKSLTFFSGSVAGGVWGAAAALGLAAIPLTRAWRDYSATPSATVSRAEVAASPTLSRSSDFTVTPAATLGSPEAVVTALLALADRYGLGEAAKGRCVAIIATLPREWVHEVVLTLDRRMPHAIRGTEWHHAVSKSLVAIWQPRRVPDDLFAARKALQPYELLSDMFKACAAVDLPATRKLLENFVTEERLGHLQQRSGPHCDLATAVIAQALKDCPHEVAAIFDKAPRMAWIGNRWEFPATQEMREAAKDPAIRKILTDSLPAMQDGLRRRRLQNILLSFMPVPERLAYVEAIPDPVQRAEAATAVAGVNEESLKWWEQQVPAAMQPQLAVALAEFSKSDVSVAMDWIERMGEAAGGAEFDGLRAESVERIRGSQEAPAERLAEMANRIIDPALRAATLGNILRWGSAKGEAWKEPWMQQHLTPEEQAEFAVIMRRKPAPTR